MTTRPPAAPESPIVAAVRKPENRIAAGVLAVVVGVVWGIAQQPLEPGFAVDLRETARFGGARHVAWIGLSEPGEHGRRMDSTRVRLVWNRPLPAAFELEIEARAMDGAENAPLEIAIGERFSVHVVEDSGTTIVAQVENPAGRREIALTRNFMVNVALARVAVR